MNWIILAETSGKIVPEEISTTTAAINNQLLRNSNQRQFLPVKLGIEALNGSERSFPNSSAAVNAGARMVQGTVAVPGILQEYANLCAVIPALHDECGYNCLCSCGLQKLTTIGQEIRKIVDT